MNVGEICNRDVVIAHRDESVLEAARRMRDYHVGALVVVEQTTTQRPPIGILTDRDIVISVLARDIEDMGRLSVGDVMTFEVVTAGESDSVESALDAMRRHGVRRLPVVGQSGGLVGIVSTDDILELAAERLTTIVGLLRREQEREREARR